MTRQRPRGNPRGRFFVLWVRHAPAIRRRAQFLDECRIALVPENETLIRIRVSCSIRGERVRHGEVAAVGEDEPDGIFFIIEYRFHRTAALAGKYGGNDISIFSDDIRTAPVRDAVPRRYQNAGYNDHRRSYSLPV